MLAHSAAFCIQALRSQAVQQCQSHWPVLGRTLHTQHAPHQQANPIGPPAFAFDIDGVLIRGKQVLQAARDAAALVFLTNGGGVTEARKAEQLSAWLEVPVSSHQVVLSHTPMRSLAHHLADKPVLLAGRGDVEAVARSYGFQKLMTTNELARALPTALPFYVEPSPHTRRGAPCPVQDLGWGTEAHPIAAALVFTDPPGANWYGDLQLLFDVVSSHGVPMRSSPLPGSKPIELVFSNPDLLWASSHPRPRFGQGAFSSALNALYNEVTGGPLPNARWFGKPNPQPYRLAERLLLEQAVNMGLCPPEGNLKGRSALLNTFSAIYMCGDNPAADIRGAVQAGPPWVSVLVRTGVFQDDAPNSKQDPAHIVVPNVLDAVQAILHRTRTAKWHSLR